MLAPSIVHFRNLRLGFQCRLVMNVYCSCLYRGLYKRTTSYIIRGDYIPRTNPLYRGLYCCGDSALDHSLIVFTQTLFPGVVVCSCKARYYRTQKSRSSAFARQSFQVGSSSKASAEKIYDWSALGQSPVFKPTGWDVLNKCSRTFVRGSTWQQYGGWFALCASAS